MEKGTFFIHRAKKKPPQQKTIAKPTGKTQSHNATPLPKTRSRHKPSTQNNH